VNLLKFDREHEEEFHDWESKMFGEQNEEQREWIKDFKRESICSCTPRAEIKGMNLSKRELMESKNCPKKVEKSRMLLEDVKEKSEEVGLEGEGEG